MKRNIVSVAACLTFFCALPHVQAVVPAGRAGFESVGWQTRSQPPPGGGHHAGRQREHRQSGGWGGPTYYAVGPPPAPFSRRSARRYRSPSYQNGYQDCPDYRWYGGSPGWR